MCLTLPETLITVIGIEKVVPEFTDLEVFLQLLPRSSTGERMNPYTSLWTGVTAHDGPREFHLILLDNGRTATLADEVGRQALACIRCSACLNVCPVYERTGGHAYGSVYPGPIGAVLTPQLAGFGGDAKDVSASLPFASSLCGACYDACPVKIDIPEVLVHLRATAVEAKRAGRVLPSAEGMAMKASAKVLSSPALLTAAQTAARLGGRVLGRDGRIGPLPGPGRAWSDARDSPVPPAQSFRSWWTDEHERNPRGDQ
jgi:L-lactate dehydrogenase complex protein LldF